jgi:hypothetical protein
MLFFRKRGASGTQIRQTDSRVQAYSKAQKLRRVNPAIFYLREKMSGELPHWVCCPLPLHDQAFFLVYDIGFQVGHKSAVKTKQRGNEANARSANKSQRRMRQVD